MKIGEVAELIKGKIVSGFENSCKEIKIAFASDLMSYVLKIDRDSIR